MQMAKSFRGSFLETDLINKLPCVKKTALLWAITQRVVIIPFLAM